MPVIKVYGCFMGKLKYFLGLLNINFSKNSCASWSQNWLPGTNLGAKIGYPGTKLGAKIGYPEQIWEPKLVSRNKLGAKIVYPDGVRKVNQKCLEGVWTVSR